MASIESQLLPSFDVESRHSIEIQARPEVVWPVARRLDMSGSLLIRTLFLLRGLPASALTIDGLKRLRFKPVLEIPGEALAIGIIGRFWTLKGDLLDFDPAEFSELSEPGYAKALWTISVRAQSSERSVLETSTRILCSDEVSARRFKRYWRLIGPFSGLIRTELLRSIRRAVEQ